MSRARLRAWLLALLVVIGAAGLAYAVARQQPARLPPRAPAQRPTLLLVTSLPLVFGEQFSIEGGGSPALQALETRYRVVPISVTDRAELSKGRLLLMAQPRAQPAEDLVALDRMGARRRPGPAAGRSDARMAERPPAGRPAAAAADLRGHRAAWPLGPEARCARRTWAEWRPARRLRYNDGVIGDAVGPVRDRPRSARRPLPPWAGPRDDRRRRGFPQRQGPRQAGPATTSTPLLGELALLERK